MRSEEMINFPWRILSSKSNQILIESNQINKKEFVFITFLIKDQIDVFSLSMNVYVQTTVIGFVFDLRYWINRSNLICLLSNNFTLTNSIDEDEHVHYNEDAFFFVIYYSFAFFIVNERDTFHFVRMKKNTSISSSR